MSLLLHKYNICRKIDNYLRREIKLFYIFDDIRGNNILFVTSDDSVYALGSNRWAQLGLGHNEPIEAPVLIPELCHQNIHYSGWLATNGEN
ncbi:unnamed protein product [Oppiella nova]|uniref:Uncharacterized protein n=1 Tax=Oppiella nova TaxID=334625 RepID=A0A7R9LYV4_9ACAR|nr:unnamed protein product [Oppiella nova]CAG2167636.1 unnamed protein product [Oppiella nova]